MMTPRMRTLLAYLDERPHRFEFDDVELAHLAGGYCISTPEYYICARPVVKGHPEMGNPFAEFDLEDCDCWFVWMAGGDLRLLWTIVPHDLQYTAFYRHNTQRIRYYETCKLQRRAEVMGGGGGGGKQAEAPKAAPQAVPSSADTATASRSKQVEAAKRKQQQRTMFGGAPTETNVLG